ncbi:MAG: hypothetical protein ACI9DC_001116 [Gammaproteobacteria bacterium]|jgi:hypothetical protein
MNRATRRCEQEFSGLRVCTGEMAQRDVTPANPRSSNRLGTQTPNYPARLTTPTPQFALRRPDPVQYFLNTEHIFHTDNE